MRKTQIYVLSLTLLKNDKHMAITAFMAEALTMFSIADTVVSRFAAAFLAAYEIEEKAFQRIDRKELTRNVNAADAERIKALRLLRDALRLFTYQNDEQKKEAAGRILEVIDLYGGVGIYTQPVDSRTGNINNIVVDLEKSLSAAVQTLDFANVVANLKTANQLFLKCQSDRDLADSDYGKNAMAEARVEVDRIWRALVEEVNNAIAYGTDEDREALVPFAKYMNVEIDRYRIQNGQGVGGSTNRPTDNEGAAGDTGTGGTETTPVMKEATFRKADGTATILQFAVGAPIEYPDNTVGYMWKPLLEFMPKTNKTFTEVPIIDAEAIATFHFADHREEEIRQIVGTILHGPANTTGYYWQPAVPSTMPAEDTSYYELPLENNGGNNGSGSGENNGSGSGGNGGSGSGENTGSGGSGENTGGGTSNKFTVTYKYPETGEVITTQEYEVGEKIVPPTPPTGYVWGYYPDNMPDRNVFVDALPDVIDF